MIQFLLNDHIQHLTGVQPTTNIYFELPMTVLGCAEPIIPKALRYFFCKATKISKLVVCRVVGNIKNLTIDKQYPQIAVLNICNKTSLEDGFRR